MNKTLNQYGGIWNTPWKLSIAAGILLGLGFPPVNLPFLQIPAFIFLLRIVDLSESGRQLRFQIYPALLIWNIIVTYWLMLASIAAGTAAILLNALLMLIPLSLIRSVLKSSVHRGLAVITIATVWSAYEFMIHNWDLSWTWLTLANGWANLPSLIQYISFTGYLSVSFWVVLSASLCYVAMTSEGRYYAKTAAALLIAFPVISQVINYSVSVSETDSLEVTVIQPNIDSYLVRGGFDSLDSLLNHYISVTDSVMNVTTGTDLIVWPENAIDSRVSLDSYVFPRLREALVNWNSDLITGIVFLEYYNNASEEPPLVFERNSNGVGYNIFNAALHLSPSEAPVADRNIYKKGNLVPLVERTPYAYTLSKLDIFTSLDWGRISNFGKGTVANNFSINGDLTPALVCYDSVFPQWVGEFVRNGATFLTIITNDGWWGNTSGHAQHFSYARLRAIEYRRWVVRSANNGISGFINPAGDVLESSDYGVRTAMTQTIYPSESLTFYARYGNWFNWILVVVALTGTLYCRMQNRRSGTTTYPD